MKDEMISTVEPKISPQPLNMKQGKDELQPKFGMKESSLRSQHFILTKEEKSTTAPKKKYTRRKNTSKKRRKRTSKVCDIQPVRKKPKKPTQFSCRPCGAKFSSRLELVAHKRESPTCKGKTSWTCSRCGVPFSNSKMYGKHRDKCHGIATCHICGKIFSDTSTLGKHRYAAHPSAYPQPPKAIDTSAWPSCTLCGATFQHQSDLTDHVKDCEASFSI